MMQENKMKRVLFRGPVLTQSGYGTHARQVARWLLSKPDLDVKFQALPWGNTPWLVNHDAHNGLIGRIIQQTTDVATGYDLSFQLQLPNEWDPKCARYNVGMTAGVETTLCNSKWRDSCRAMTAIVVPSPFVAKNLESTGPVGTNIYVIPESFPDSCVNVPSPHPDMAFSTPINFLIFGQLTGNNPFSDRKNTFMMLKWLSEEFANDTDVGIVLKTNMGRNTKIDRQATRNLLSSVLREARKGPGPKVSLIHGDVPEDVVVSLYGHPHITALCAATRGEGFGLPILEAAAVGLPVIATGWSGHTSFMDPVLHDCLKYTLVPVHQSRIDNGIFVPGAMWAEPNEAEFKRITRDIVEEQRTLAGGARRGRAAELRKKLLTTHTFDAVSKIYDQRLGEFVRS